MTPGVATVQATEAIIRRPSTPRATLTHPGSSRRATMSPENNMAGMPNRPVHGVTRPPGRPSPVERPRGTTPTLGAPPTRRPGSPEKPAAPITTRNGRTSARGGTRHTKPDLRERYPRPAIHSRGAKLRPNPGQHPRRIEEGSGYPARQSDAITGKAMRPSVDRNPPSGTPTSLLSQRGESRFVPARNPRTGPRKRVGHARQGHIIGRLASGPIRQSSPGTVTARVLFDSGKAPIPGQLCRGTIAETNFPLAKNQGGTTRVM